MDNGTHEQALIHIMNEGFNRAAGSFSKMINRPVRIVDAQFLFVHQDRYFSYTSEKDADLDVLTTHIIGDLSGKSFLIFNNEESQEIFRVLNTTSEELKEAFLLEIDNIVSASVISEISNELSIEVYGAVPQLTKMSALEFQTFMEKEVADESHARVVFCNTTFQFGAHEQVHPQFIWKLSSKIFEMIALKDSGQLKM